MNKKLFENRYELDVLLGEGGVGQVWMAEDREHPDRGTIALKYPRSEYKNEARFVDEAKIMQGLKHDSIIKILNVGNSPEYGEYYTMEYFPDGSLVQFLSRSGRIFYVPGQENLIYIHFDYLLQIMEPILNGLAFAHSQGVLHRDFKLSNILVNSQGNRFVLTDFSLNAGAPVIMSPEQLKEWKNEPFDQLDWRSDLYAVGACMYKLLTGGYPFSVPSEDPRKQVDEMYDLIFTQKAALIRPSQRNPHNQTITPALDELLIQLLQRGRRARTGQNPKIPMPFPLKQLDDLYPLLKEISLRPEYLILVNPPSPPHEPASSSPSSSTAPSESTSQISTFVVPAAVLVALVIFAAFVLFAAFFSIGQGSNPENTPASASTNVAVNLTASAYPSSSQKGEVLPGDSVAYPTATHTPSPTATPSRTPTPRALYPRPVCSNDSGRITFPGVGEPISRLTEIRGRADDVQFDYYKIEYLVENSTSWSCCVVNPNKQRVTQDGVLGTIDPDKLDPSKSDFVYKGKLRIRLLVVRQDGNYAEPCETYVIIR